MPVILPCSFGHSGGRGWGTSRGPSRGRGRSKTLAVSVGGVTSAAASASIDVSASSSAASLQRCLDALAYTERADKEAIANWKNRVKGETDDEYKYMQEGDAPGIVFSALWREEQRRELALAPATLAAPVAVSDATGLVIAENDTIDDGGGEGEDNEFLGESSEVLLLMPRHIGATVVGIGGCVGGRGHRLPFRNCNPRLVLFPGNEVLPASSGPSLLVQALSTMHGDQGIFTNSEVASARGSHPESPSCAAGSAQCLAITTPSV
jgi:hypothetical protein